MKRLLGIGLGALALVASTIFITPVAHADTAPADCTHATGSTWPSTSTYYCTGGASADASTMASLINGASGQQQHVLTRSGVVFLEYGTPSQYETSEGSNAVPLTQIGNAFAIVKYDSNQNPQHIAVFKQNQAGTTNPNLSYNFMRKVGESIDWFDGYVTNGGIPNLYFSNGSTNPAVNLQLSKTNSIDTGMASTAAFGNVWKEELDDDWSTINGMASCGSSGIFFSRKDAAGNYICSSNGTGTTLSATYSGLNNQHVLSAAYPSEWGADIVGDYPALFTAAYATSYGAGDGLGNTSATFYVGYLACSQATLKYIAGNGALPTLSNLPSGKGCTAPVQDDGVTAMVTVCQRLFSSSDFAHYPAGNVYNCVLTGTSAQTGLAASVQADLQSIGGSTTYVQPKGVLAGTNDQILMFASASAYSSAFAEAGVPSVKSFGSGVAAQTWQTSGTPVIWTIDREDNSAGTTVAAHMTILNHELGHALDFTYPTPSSFPSETAAFVTATNDDFTAIDAVANPCGSSPTGPLVGVSYITSSMAIKPFCISGSFTTDPDSAVYHQGGNVSNPPIATSLILKNTNVMGIYFPASPQYPEWYAQAFAVQANPADGGSVYSILAHANAAAVTSNGYFGCTASRTNGWLHWIYTGQTSNPTSGQLPSGCN